MKPEEEQLFADTERLRNSFREQNYPWDGAKFHITPEVRDVLVGFAKEQGVPDEDAKGFTLFGMPVVVDPSVSADPGFEIRQEIR